MEPKLFAQAIVSLEDKYGLRLDAQDVWLRLDEFKKVKELKGGKCNETKGWYGLKGACKRGKRGEGEIKSKESKLTVASKIRDRKGMKDRLTQVKLGGNVGKEESQILTGKNKMKATQKSPQLTEDQKRILGNDIDNFIGRQPGISTRREEFLRSAVVNGDARSLKDKGKDIYYSHIGAENKREYRTAEKYSEAFAAHAMDRFSKDEAKK